MQKPHVASRLFGKAIGEFEALGGRGVGGDGFADSFPDALAQNMKQNACSDVLG